VPVEEPEGMTQTPSQQSARPGPQFKPFDTQMESVWQMLPLPLSSGVQKELIGQSLSVVHGAWHVNEPVPAQINGLQQATSALHVASTAAHIGLGSGLGLGSEEFEHAPVPLPPVVGTQTPPVPQSVSLVQGA
jgi:hypothetical protein